MGGGGALAGGLLAHWLTGRGSDWGLAALVGRGTRRDGLGASGASGSRERLETSGASRVMNRWDRLEAGGWRLAGQEDSSQAAFRRMGKCPPRG